MDGNYQNVPSAKKRMGFKKKLLKKLKVFLLLLIMVITFFMISISFKKVVNLSYKENSNINYLVYLKENDYYDEPYLTKGMQYIASLIDYVDVNFNYNFKMNDEIKYDYYYYIESDVKVFEKGNKNNVIYHKTKKILEDKLYTNQDSLGFTIDEDLKIDYSEYNNLVRAFKNSYNIVADSNLTLTLYIYIDGVYDDFKEPVRTNNKMELVIPLSEQMLNVSMNYKEINNSDVVKLVDNDSALNRVFLGLTIFASALLSISLVDLIMHILKGMKRKSPYQKKIESILREYDRVIVEVSQHTAIKNDTNLIAVKSFSELLDVSDRLEQPILHFETKKGERSQFVIIKDANTYFYVVDASDIEE